MGNYYSEALNATKLYDVYQTEIEGVRRYLQQEIEFVRGRLSPGDTILELGAGYGRIMRQLAPAVRFVYGIDISGASVAFGQAYLEQCPNCKLSVADAYAMDGTAAAYDAVLCLQNGLSAFKGDAEKLVRVAMTLLKDSGTAYFSSYHSAFWDVRLAWFQEQAGKGLLGEIDDEKTGNGTILCKDGFAATTFSADDLERLGRASGHRYAVEEVDSSSVFLILQK